MKMFVYLSGSSIFVFKRILAIHLSNVALPPPVAILRGGAGLAMAPQIFAWPPQIFS